MDLLLVDAEIYLFQVMEIDQFINIDLIIVFVDILFINVFVF